MRVKVTHLLMSDFNFRSLQWKISVNKLCRFLAHSLAMNEVVSAIIYRHLCACIKINIQKSNLNIIYQQINTEQQLVYALLTQYSLTKANSANRYGSSVPDRWFQSGFKINLINSSSPSPRQDIMSGVVTRLETMIMQIYESEGAIYLSLFVSQCSHQ